MQAILLSREEVAQRAKQLYESKIRQKVEVEENIGKMVIIDIETGDYEVDKTGLQASRQLSKKHYLVFVLDITLLSHLVVLWSVSASDFWDCAK
jgi:hypothetical protein